MLHPNLLEVKTRECAFIVRKQLGTLPNKIIDYDRIPIQNCRYRCFLSLFDDEGVKQVL